MARNAAALRLIAGAEIVRWEDGLSDVRFSAARDRFLGMASTSGSFQTALDATISAFWTRNADRFGHGRRGEFEVASRAFLIEELAVFSYQCLEDGIDAYAGSWMEEIFTVLKQDADPFFAAFRKDWLQVDFRRNKGFVSDIAMAA